MKKLTINDEFDSKLNEPTSQKSSMQNDEFFQYWYKKEQLDYNKQIRNKVEITWIWWVTVTQDKNKFTINMSVNYYVGNSSRLSSAWTGTQAITWLGFKPKMILIQAVYASTVWGFSNWQATSTSDEYAIYNLWNPNPWVWSYQAGQIIRLQSSIGNVSSAELASIDDDWFTLNWTSMQLDAQFMYQCYW